LGITDFDKEGMLVEDFDLEGSMTAIYNYPYYPQIMEQLGYQKEVDWVQIRVNIPQEVPAKYARVSQLTKEMFDLHVRQLTLQDFREGYGRKIFHLLNQAYAPIYGFTEFNEAQADAFVNQYLRVINLELLPAVENKDGEVIAVAVTMGSLNKALRKANGRLLPFGWYHLLRSLKWKYEESAEMLLIAVRPDFQGLGVNAIFFDHLIPIYHKFGFKWAETGPQLDYNIRELSQWKPLNPDIVKRRRCYFKEIKN
jgi:GNAT superfamily N-acetyltransferase